MTKNKVLAKIADDALIKNVKRYLNGYNYEGARCLNCSKTGILTYYSKAPWYQSKKRSWNIQNSDIQMPALKKT